MNRDTTLFTLLAMLPAALLGATIAASPDPTGAWLYPLGQRLFYLHVPLAWGAYAAFTAALITAVLVFTRSSPPAARWMQASTETTAVYAAASLASGLAWSYEFQLYTPLADPKVLTTLVLCLAAGGLWAFAANTSYAHPRRRAALTLLAFLAVPASYLASRISVHPDFVRDTSIDATLGTLLAIATIGILLLAAALIWLRARMLKLEQEVVAS